MINDSKNFREGRIVFWTLKFVATLAVLVVLPISGFSQIPGEGRIHITFLKAGHGSGSGYLFFQGHKYGLSVSSATIGRVWVTAIDLIGTVSNLHSAADIIGTYTATDDQDATVKHAKVARLQNTKGTVLEMRAVNLNRLFSLNLSEITLKNLGWEPSSE